jgi:hypothetical protein
MLPDLLTGIACIVVGAITLTLGFVLRNRSTDPYRIAAPAGVIGCFLLFVGFVILLKLLVG